MDLIGDMLMQTLPASPVAGSRPCSSGRMMHQRWSRLPLVGQSPRMQLADRLTGRLWDYPRWLAPRVREFDVFHVVDHSYAHVMRVLPAERTVVTCNDVDAITAALPSSSAIGTGRIAGQIGARRRLARGACRVHQRGDQDTARSRADEWPPHVPASPTSAFIRAAGRHRTECAATADVLHVGSTIPRKRIDVLLEVFAGARQQHAAASTGPGGRPAHRRTARSRRPVSASSTASSRCRRSIATSLPISTARGARPAAVRSRGIRASARRGDGVRHAGRGERTFRRFAKSAAMRPSTVRRAT